MNFFPFSYVQKELKTSFSEQVLKQAIKLAADADRSYDKAQRAYENKYSQSIKWEVDEEAANSVLGRVHIRLNTFELLVNVFESCCKENAANPRSVFTDCLKQSIPGLSKMKNLVPPNDPTFSMIESAWSSEKSFCTSLYSKAKDQLAIAARSFRSVNLLRLEQHEQNFGRIYGEKDLALETLYKFVNQDRRSPREKVPTLVSYLDQLFVRSLETTLSQSYRTSLAVFDRVLRYCTGGGKKFYSCMTDKQKFQVKSVAIKD